MTNDFENVILDNCVIGSGPSGIFLSLGLVEKDEPVYMFDIGKKINNQIQTSLDHTFNSPFSEWSSQTKALFLETCLPQNTALPKLKHLFGSNFLYDSSIVKKPRLSEDKMLLYSSKSLGGFSKVWGTNVMPFHENDFKDWPISLPDLQQFYKKVINFTPYTAAQDNLSSHFPLYGTPTGRPQLTPQSNTVFSTLNSHKHILNKSNIFFGYSRLMANLNKPSCHRCGLCLCGCPYNLLYSSDMTLNYLKKFPKFSYQSTFTLNKFEEKENYVLLHFITPNKKHIQIKTRRLFLSTGVLSTSKLILKSIPDISNLTLLDSHYFLLPAFTKDSINIQNTVYHSLAQLYLDICNSTLSPHWVHLQLYGYNLFYDYHFQYLFKHFYNYFPNFFKHIINKLWTIQGFLHSDHSSKVDLSYCRKSDSLNSFLIENPTLRPLLKTIYSFLKKQKSKTGLTPLPFLSKDSTFGSSFHTGGTLKMASNPKEKQTSINGKLWCSNRVHVVDSSILPTIPSTTITYSLMANAYRIGAAV